MKYWILFVALPMLAAAPARADDGKIAFSSNRTGNREIFTVSPDGSNLQNLTKTSDADEDYPAWSPDGRRLVYSRPNDLWLMKADGSNQHAVGVGHSTMQAAFGPGPNLLTYVRFGGQDADVYTIRPDGTNEVRIINNPLGDYSPRWNADSSKVAFYTFPNGPDIFVANPDGSGQKQITTSNTDRNPCWSPDGKRIVFQSYRSGNEEIYIMNADGSHQVRLTNNSAADITPVFSPDGNRIAFVSNRTGNNEIFVMNLDGTGLIRVTNNPADDVNPSWQQNLPTGAPSVAISDARVTEGNSGTTTANFTVSLSASWTAPVSVTCRVYPGTATPNTDYTPIPATTLNFDPGETTKTLSVPIRGDILDENDETFSVRITAVGALVSDVEGLGTIADDDAMPILDIQPVSVLEGDSGTTRAVFPVTLSAASGRPVTADFTTENLDAVAGADYVAKHGRLTIPAGSTLAKIPVDIIGDNILEDDEDFHVVLSNVTHAKVAHKQAHATIRNDDTTPALSIGNATVAEGNTASFTLNLSHTAPTPVTVHYATSDGSARAGSDYTAKSGLLTIPAGQSTATIAVATLDDDTPEADENFFVTLSNPAGAVLDNSQGMATITSDDFPKISISSVTQDEGDSGLRDMYFTVTLSDPAPFVVSVNYATADGVAQAPADYTAASGVLSFAPGQTSAALPIQTRGDGVFESNETFFVNLSGASHGNIRTGQGIGTIVNDDAAPTLSVDDVTIKEGDSGSTNAVFTVTLSAASQQPVTLNYATTDGTATAGSDYTAQSGPLTIPAGETSATISVPIIGDTSFEGDETFTLNLSDVAGGTLGNTQATATIQDDDTAPQQPSSARGF